MGKHRTNRGKHHSQGMDQSGKRDRSDSPEQRGLPIPGSAGSASVLPSGHDEPAPARASNVIPIGKPDIRRGAERLRLHRGAAPEIRRTFNAPADIDWILNDPSVFPALAVPGIDKFELSGLLSDGRNVAFGCEGGCLIFAYLEPGIYETHIGFLAGYRGAYAKKAFMDATRLMFMTTSALTLLIRIPDTNRAARMFYANAGAKQEFHREAAWPTAEGPIGQSFWAIRYDNWILSNLEMVACGEFFVHQLNDARERSGHAPETFEPCSHRYLGAFMLMACAGQLDKAVILFNRFAGFAKLPMFALVSHTPAVVDTGETLIQFAENEFKVLLCKQPPS